MSGKRNPVKIVTDTVSIGTGVNRLEFTFESTRVVGNDDPVYSGDRSVWENVPRGCVKITASMSPSPLGLELPAPIVVANVQGLRKFGYSTDVCYGRPERTLTVIALDKENGENAQVAAFTMDDREPPEPVYVPEPTEGESLADEPPVAIPEPKPRPPIRYWVVGSKHVHIVFRHGHVEEDLERYKTNTRYTYALQIADLFNRVVLLNEDVLVDEFHAWLCEHKFTAIAEAILMKSQHIVDYGHDQLRFFATSMTKPSSAGLCAQHPHSALCSLAYFGLQVPWYSDAVLLKSDEYRKLVAAVRERSNTEGTVMYGVDAEGRVCAMWKEKGVEYVLERAARESILGKHSHAALQKRLRDRAADLIADGFTNPDVVREWLARREPWLLKFRAWLHSEKKLPVADDDTSVSRWDVQSSWLTLQHEFESVADTYVPVADAEPTGPKVVLLSGLPGSGKSTLARALFVALKARGAVPRWANQDEVDGSKNKRKAYLALIQEAVKDTSVTHIILDKCNLDPANRTDYTELGITTTVAVSMLHPADKVGTYTHLFETCSSRIHSRGEGHRSLRVGADGKVAGGTTLGSIMTTMTAAAKPIHSSEAATHLNLSVLDARDTHLVMLWHALGCEPLTPEELAHALDVSAAYEAELAKNPKHVVYWSIALGRESRAKLLEVVPHEALVGKTPLGEVHSTLQFIGAWTDPETNVRLGQLRGKTVPLRITGIAWDDKGVAARVESEVPSTNKHPHITLALAHGVKPVYSNELLDGDCSFVPVDLALYGTVTAH